MKNADSTGNPRGECSRVNTKLALGVLAIGAFAATGLADSSWKGDRADENVNWSLASNWDGEVPTGNVKATVAYTDSGRSLTMTPPLDFTGTIVCGGDNRDWAAGFDSTLKLNVLDGATWTVGHSTLAGQHDGTLVATPGLDARIGSDFAGMVIVPRGVSFTAGSTLNDSVEFAGDGELTLTKATQLARIQSFTGTVVWNGGTDLSPEDTSALQCHTIRFADGQTLTLPEKMLSLHAARAIPDFSNASSWSFNGGAPFQSLTSRWTFDAEPPHVNDKGKLELVNDAGQKHSVVFKDRKFGMTDTWGVHFRLLCNLVDEKKYAGINRQYGGFFGVYLVPTTDNVSTTATVKDGPVPPTTASGFCVSVNSDTMLWQLPGDTDRWLSLDRTARAGVGAGVTFMGEPIDLDVTFSKGVMVAVASQGGKTIAVRRTRFDSFYTRKAVKDGYYLAFGGSSSWTDSADTIIASPMTISNFRGWYRSREAGAWTTVSNASDFYPITAEKWRARRYTDASTYVEGADAIENDGSFLMQPNSSYRRTLLGSYTALSTKKRYLLGWDFVGGSGNDGETTERLKFGFVTYPESEYGSWIFDYTRLGEGSFESYCRAFAVSIYPWGGNFSFQVIRNWWTDSDQFERTASVNYSWPKSWHDQTLKTQYLYDGDGGFYLQVASDAASTLIDAHYIPEAKYRNYFRGRGNMYLCFENDQSWGWTTTAIKNIDVKELTGNSSPYLSSTLEVPASATVTVQADSYDVASTVPATEIREAALAAGATLNVTTVTNGSRVAIDALRVMGGGATVNASAKTIVGGLVFAGDTVQTQPANLSGDVAFADGTLTLVIPEAWRHGAASIPLFKGVAMPQSYRILTDSGKDVTTRMAVYEKDGEVTLTRKGLFFCIR